MAGIKWTKEENKALTGLWPTASKEEICKFFNRTYDAIIIQASKLGIKKFYEKHPYVQTDLSVLLKDDPISLYWVGFFFADGSVNENKRISLTLSKKDEQHLLAFKEFCKIPTHIYVKNNVGVKAQDKFTVSKFCEKYDLKPNKTCNPPQYIPETEDMFLPFIIGFIDGDGCIKYQSGRKDSLIAIKLHNSWLNYLNRLGEMVADIANVKPTKAKINTKGYAIIHFCNTTLLKMLKRKALSLPVLQRKWDKIDLDYVSKNELMLDNRKELAKLVKKGLRNRDIAVKLGVSDAWVSINKRKIK